MPELTPGPPLWFRRRDCRRSTRTDCCSRIRGLKLPIVTVGAGLTVMDDEAEAEQPLPSV